MTLSIVLHLVLGVVCLIAGVWLLRHRRPVLGWLLSVLGTTIVLFGIFAPILHRHLHH